MKYVHAVYELAEKSGYISDSGFRGIVERMEAENKKRQEKGKNWEVVYGLAEYSLEVDIEHEMSRLKKNG